MTANRVDTTLPEHSWIPFYEELAHKLVNEGWRNRQPELVQMLKEMNDESVPIPKPLADYASNPARTHLDPFTFFAMLSGALGWDNTKEVMKSLKDGFKLKSALPEVKPHIPSEVPLNLFFFNHEKVDNYIKDIEKLWDTFEFVVGIDNLDQQNHHEELIRRINDCLPIMGVKINKLSKGLYWVNPHNFLHVATINSIGGKVLGEEIKEGNDLAANSYWHGLMKTKEVDITPFPILNIEVDTRTYQLPKPEVWQIRAGGNGEAADSFLQGECIGVNYDMNGVDMSGVATRNDVERLYQEENTVMNEGRVNVLTDFLIESNLGDYVIMPSDDKETLHYGRLASETPYYEPDQDAFFRNRRKMIWEGKLTKSELPALPVRGQAFRKVAGAKNEFFKLIGRHDLVDGIYTIQSMLDEGVFLEHEEIERMKDILQNKKNLILQGPPGVGKTFIARKLAYVLMGEKADARITSVQFHQSYSYEDFVGGLRPDVGGDQQLIFTPQDGTFLKLCDKARDDSDNKYVMLIDEVNRGNLSRVFGELLMLIEADKRTEDNAIELQHQRNTHGDADNNDDDDGKADKFFVPENVYIIGTMNLADRSLTGMNIAMRRRFGFVELEPQFDKNVFKNWLKTTAMPDNMQTRIHSKMSALNNAIATDISLGKNYAVGHSFFCPSEDVKDWEEWYKRVVDYEIRPLLEEYWFDKLEEADKHVKDLKEG